MKRIKVLILRFICALFLGAFAAFVSLSLFTFCPSDLSILFDTTQKDPLKNYCGYIGSNFAAILFYFLGNSAYFSIPIMFILFAGLLGVYNLRNNKERLFALFGLMLTFSLVENYFNLSYITNLYPGGTIGYIGINFLKSFFDPILLVLFLYIVLFSFIVLIDNLSSIKLIQPIVAKLLYPFSAKVFKVSSQLSLKSKELLCKIFKQLPKQIIDVFYLSDSNLYESDELSDEVENIFNDPFWSTVEKEFNGNKSDNKNQTEAVDLLISKNLENIQNASKTVTVLDNKSLEYELPLNIFKQSKFKKIKNENVLKEQDQSTLLEEKLTRFGIRGKVVSITSGPIVTLYEYAPEPEIKISTILAREDDLALALEALSLRIIAPIPGKSVVGFEVAHHSPEPVMFYELINQAQDKIKNLSVPLLLGTNTQGLPVVADLVKLPHLLLAGTTGSGKSVAVQNMIMTILCNKTPELVKLILIDPKRLELSVYADIGHLLFPVVTEPKQALTILNWALGVMEERYTILAKAGVKNCIEYHELDEENKFLMPFIVIVIDELADLMMTAGKDLEISLVRLAQMARASGIHLITATQRPSVDVVTGLIKINFPSRLACKVASKIDSRTILDTGGAEKLLGKGDMLFLNPSGSLQRLHGAYVSSEDIELVSEKIRSQWRAEYEKIDSGKKESIDLEDQDELFDEALDFIKSRSEVSISLIQRKFKIGYNRSARLIEQLENSGYVLPPSGSKMRKVNLDNEASSENDQS